MTPPHRILSLLLCCICSACALRPAALLRPTAAPTAPTAEIPLPGPSAPAAPPVVEPGPVPLYRSWWFWGAVGLAVIGGASLAIGANLGGTDRVARGPDGRFDPATFDNRGATP